MIEKLKTQIAARLRQATDCGGEKQGDGAQVELRNLRLRLSRAEHAAKELSQRVQRRYGQATRSPGVPTDITSNGTSTPMPERAVPGPLFTGRDFRPDPDRNVLICPGNQELRFIGEYPTEHGRSRYRLYGRRDCGDCPLGAQCTNGRGRRTKVLPDGKVNAKTAPLPAAPLPPTQEPVINDISSGAGTDEHLGGPRASVTEPEAVMMLATSEKRWESCYNADLAATRHGVIISQFLTKHPTDFSHFGTALGAVISAVGKPETWVGDGHYGTQANVVLADGEGVFLYAPPAWDPVSGVGEDDGAPQDLTEGVSALAGPDDREASRLSTERFNRHHFQPDPARQILVCPASQKLRLVGDYTADNGPGTYRLYSRSDCAHCPQKHRCTNAKGRRVKVPIRDRGSLTSTSQAEKSTVNPARNLVPLLDALEKRMSDVGDAVLKFRRETIEPVNAHLKQHGLGRFHAHGLARCQAILTLACIGHNLNKWKARETARSLKAVA